MKFDKKHTHTHTHTRAHTRTQHTHTHTHTRTHTRTHNTHTHIWAQKKSLEEKVDEIFTRILCAVLNESLKQHPTKQLFHCSFNFPFHKTSKVHKKDILGPAEEDEHKSHLLKWTHSHWHTYVYRYSMGIGCCL